MKKAFLFLLFVCMLNCKINEPKINKNLAVNNTKVLKSGVYLNYFDTETKPSEEPYLLNIKTEKLTIDTYNISFFMKMKNGVFFVSPNAKRDFKGKFKIVIDSNDKLTQIDKLVETPLSIEEYNPHPFVNGNVNWVKENTNYALKIKRNSTKDFKVTGYVQFTIEPRCTLEKIPFIIIYKSGKIKTELLQC